jgi:hypothetical protein
MRLSLIRRNMPKSWGVFVIGALAAQIIFLPIGLFASYMEWRRLFVLSYGAFAFCWLVAAAFGIFYLVRHWSGAYRQIEDRSWSDQVW